MLPDMKRLLKWGLGGLALLVFVSVLYVGVYGSGMVYVNYADSPNADYAQLAADIEAWGYFEEITSSINASYLLPTDVNVWFVECGEVNAFYSPETREILLCLELVDHLFQTFSPYATGDEDLGVTVWNTMLFVFYHEFGHALIDILDLPVTGREEDAVDQLATVVLLEAVEGGAEAALTGANWFLISGSAATGGLPFWNEHSLDQQRFYNILCWVYGSNPDGNATLVPDWGLPVERAEQCPFEFDRMYRAWDSLLEPHVM